MISFLIFFTFSFYFTADVNSFLRFQKKSQISPSQQFESNTLSDEKNNKKLNRKDSNLKSDLNITNGKNSNLSISNGKKSVSGTFGGKKENNPVTWITVKVRDFGTGVAAGVRGKNEIK